MLAGKRIQSNHPDGSDLGAGDIHEQICFGRVVDDGEFDFSLLINQTLVLWTWYVLNGIRKLA